MLSHEQIWTAIDRLAERHGFSASGLARRAGLDATSFNRSKRVGPDGRKRWPSTESIAKVLAATGASLDDFLHLVDSGQAPTRTMVPLVGLTQAGSGRLFTEEGIPTGGPGWDEIEFPDLGDDHAFALEVQGDSMLPLYRDGDVLIVAPNAGIRKGDRIVARLTNGEVLAKELRRRTARTIELASLNPDHEDRMVPLADVAWMARVMWVRQ
ncbi:MAG TPA: helix-turn-helix transcriptional regulator [Methylobacterium sp.]|jgi:phage repressor protein C with HTH and peptisase S24 domain|uniref:S24 family peptidase n=1 Tax=Methylorubrum sp. B1-46 TaxID=2897334 RepID=UPI001E53FE3F|nr:helix-turn-helix transcriptional regulator [Methylorubrum sp. B1-46]UGB27997.1 helix-turn-helix transcriptional regulator [Methylorubrum sp. B1-46]HEV2541449.1 helix-turn-helix transcriptional regulator [Methylobacterium sp.]